MGQQQSDSAQGGSKISISYYSLLGLSRDASDDEIKKAYRKKALELHPDRNYGNIDEATRLFAEVQAAYDILSDPQERAWYDSHEEAILSGNSFEDYESNNAPVTSSDDIAKIFARLNGQTDFSDSQTGFFSSIGEAFARLAREESLASSLAGIEAIDYPSFGVSDDDYQSKAKLFYDKWMAFSTRRSFAWKDVYRLSEAPDRRVRRAMEKENKRLRDEAIKEFNDTVRTLVSFVRKRDPRRKFEAQSEIVRQETLREQSAAQAARARAANQERINSVGVPEWVVKEDPHSEVEEETYWKHEDESIQEFFECVVCDKIFKTEKQYEGHERSKKHQQAVKRIQRQMRKEGIELGLDTKTETPDAKSVYREVDADHQLGASEKSVESVPAGSNTIVDSTEDNIKTGGSKPAPPSGSVSGSSTEWLYGDYAQRDTVIDRILDLKGLDSDTAQEQTKSFVTKKGKAKQKREKRVAKQAKSSHEGFKCTSCDTYFDSKNKLFMHLKEFPFHAKPISSR